MKIRETTHNDFEKIWPIFSEIAAAGETYALSRNITKAEAKVSWGRYAFMRALSRNSQADGIQSHAIQLCCFKQ